MYNIYEKNKSKKKILIHIHSHDENVKFYKILAFLIKFSQIETFSKKFS